MLGDARRSRCRPTARCWLRYSPHDPARFVSAAEVLAGKAAPELLRDKLVLVGVTGLGLLDFQATPLGERMPGVEIHAQIIEQVFDGVYLVRPELARLARGARCSPSPASAADLLVPRAAACRFRPRCSPPWSCCFWRSASFAFLSPAFCSTSPGPALGALFAVFGILLAATLAEADRQRRALREQAARMAGELDAARRIQMGLLPDPRELFAGERALHARRALLEPARTVGGDFYDCFMLDERRLFFVVADVSGKGMPASAVHGARASRTIKSRAAQRRRPRARS